MALPSKEFLIPWETYLNGSGKVFKTATLGGTNTSASSSTRKDEEKNGDSVWNSANQATIQLAKRAGQPAVASKMGSYIRQHHQQQQEQPAVVAKTKKQKTRKRDEQEVEEEEENVKRRPPTLPPVPDGQPVPPPHVMDQIFPIETIEEHNRRDNQLGLFAVSVRRKARPTKDTIVSAPSAVKVLAYCAKYKNEMPWYSRTLTDVANSDTYTFQDIPLIRREVLVTYLREPDPKCPWERPCFNLDREPQEHETRVRCIAHRMSEAHQGPGKGYRLREMQFGNQEINILNALEANENAKKTVIDPCKYLSPIPEMCYMCHVWMTTEAALDQKNHLADRSRKDLTVPPPQQQQSQTMWALNRFMVDIDVIGEYDRRKMLVSDDIGLGIWGPFPLWNERHYIPARIVPSGLRGFEESEALLFRLPRIPLQAIESSSKNSSTRSTPTSASATASSFPQ